MVHSKNDINTYIYGNIWTNIFCLNLLKYDFIDRSESYTVMCLSIVTPKKEQIFHLFHLENLLLSENLATLQPNYHLLK